MEGKNKFWLGDIKERQFSVMLHWLPFKITFTVLYVQFCMSQKRICCLVASQYVVNGFHDLLWLVFGFFEYNISFMYPRKKYLRAMSALICNGLFVKKFVVQIFPHLQKPVCTKLV